MSLATRETLMVKLGEALSAVTGVTTFARNRGFLANDKHPTVILTDGDESILTRQVPGRQKMQPGLIVYRPQIFVRLRIAGPTNVTADGVNQGTLLNTFRERIVKAVRDSSDILELVGPSGSVVFEGSETDLKSGRDMEGEARFDFAFTCAFNPYAT